MEWILLIFVIIAVLGFVASGSPTSDLSNPIRSSSQITPMSNRVFLNSSTPFHFSTTNPQTNSAIYPIGIGSALFGGWLLYDEFLNNDETPLFNNDDVASDNIAAQMAGVEIGPYTPLVSEEVGRFDYNANSFDETNSGIFGVNDEFVTSDDIYDFDSSSLFEDSTSMFDDSFSSFDSGFDSFSSDSYWYMNASLV